MSFTAASTQLMQGTDRARMDFEWREPIPETRLKENNHKTSSTKWLVTSLLIDSNLALDNRWHYAVCEPIWRRAKKTALTDSKKAPVRSFYDGRGCAFWRQIRILANLKTKSEFSCVSESRDIGMFYLDLGIDFFIVIVHAFGFS